MPPKSKTYTAEEVAKHDSREDCWIILGDEDSGHMVYDCTPFLDDHPGGPEVILDLAGRNAHEEFEDIGHSQDARNQLKPLLIGKATGVQAGSGSGSGSGGSAQGGNNTLLYIAGVVVAVAVFLNFSG